MGNLARQKMSVRDTDEGIKIGYSKDGFLVEYATVDENGIKLSGMPIMDKEDIEWLQKVLGKALEYVGK